MAFVGFVCIHGIFMSVADLVSIINQLLPEPHAGLLAGILFGVKAALVKSLTDDLVTTGTIHIIALSGMNITILAAIVTTTLLWFVSRRITSLLTVVIIIGFTLFVGPSASIVRAAIMGGISMLGLVWGRQVWALWSLVLAAGIMLLVNFSWLFDLSFQLSFLATLGILLFGSEVRKTLGSEDRKREGLDVRKIGRLEEKLTSSSLPIVPSSPLFNLLSSHLLNFVRDELRVTLAAQVFTTPLIMFHFHRISLIAPLTNLLIGWTIPYITVLGIIAIIATFVWFPLGYIAGWFSWVFLEYLILAVQITSTFPFASISW